MSTELLLCFNKQPRDFLVSVAVHKARNLSALNVDTFVVVNFNAETRKTKVVENSDCPFYNEYFAFEIRSSVDDLLKNNIRICVVESSCFLKKNEIIGEVNINLTTLWNQQHHAFIKKWAVLEKIGGNENSASAGYLQCDLSIFVTNEPPAPTMLQSYDEEIVEENLLMPHFSANNFENVNYLVNIFGGSFVVKRDYILQVSFGSNHLRTRQIKYSKYCQWNEQLIFPGKFRSLSELIVFELLVLECHQWKVKCSVELNFSIMCWKTDTGVYNKPSFGPSHIYFQEGFHKNIFYGKLLVSIETEEVNGKIAMSFQDKKDIVMPLNETDYWNDEVFRVNMILVNMDALDIQQNHMKMYVNCEDAFSNTIDTDVKEYESKIKVKFVEFNSSTRPLMTLNIKLPDNRLKLQVQNLITLLIQEMESNIESFQMFEAVYHDNVEYKSKGIKLLLNDLKDMMKGLLDKLFYKTFKMITKWDENYLRHLRLNIETCIMNIKENLEKIDTRNNFQEYINVRNSLLEVLNKFHGIPPDVFLNVTCDGKLLAFHRFDMMDFFHSHAFDARGSSCGKFHSVLLKPSSCPHSCTNCGCFFGKFEVLMWIGSDKEINEWLPQNALEVGNNKVNFTVERFFKCNAFVHQAKIQPGIDKNGLCNSKLSITLNGMLMKTKVVSQSLAAVWNEVLVFENVKIFDIGDGRYAHFPSILMLLLDEDKRKKHLIGMSWMKVPIKNNNEKFFEDTKFLPKILLPEKIDIRKIFHKFIKQFPPHLRWLSFHREGSLVAEVLLSAEFIPLPCPILSLKAVEKNEPLPFEIKPNLKKFRIEVTFYGIRGALNIPFFSSGRFKIELTMGEIMLSSGFSGKSNNHNLNFLDPYASGYLLLPEQLHFWPPIIIRHLDCSHKTLNVVGAAMIRGPEKYYIEEKPKEVQKFFLNQAGPDEAGVKTIDELIMIEEDEPLLNHRKKISKRIRLKQIVSHFKFSDFHNFAGLSRKMIPVSLEKKYTWWTKFYNSTRSEHLKNHSLHEIKIYNEELEKEKKFEHLNDWAFPIALIRGKNDSENPGKYATLKCEIKITKCGGKEFFKSGKKEKFSIDFPLPRLRQNFLIELPIMVRVYAVQGINLRSRDMFTESDAFIKVELGSQEISDRAQYIQNQTNPIFGKRFQLSSVIPRDNLLKVSVYDRDTLTRSDLIGTTVIDLEDRVMTKYLASCSLMREFNSGGYNAWRNLLLPSEILSNLCVDLEMGMPQYFSDHVTLAGIDFKDTSKITKDPNKKERLALSVLNSFEKVPGVGFSLIPEHVETRSLYRDDRPGVEQGKLIMWIEIFDPLKAIPEAIDITPLPPQAFQLRVIIWNAKDVILNERNIFGKQMSDIYIKGWMNDIEAAQFTDIHFRSLNGEGNFNWRMIFDFKYSVGEDMMVTTRKKNVLEKFDTLVKMPPVLNLQIWDNDSFSADDFLGTMSINLSHFQTPFSSADKCVLNKMVGECEKNIFATDENIRGWFPVHGKEEGNESIKQTGNLELELEVLLASNAKSAPVGIGREGPNGLPQPDRPDTSFNWLENPLKSVRRILWPQLKKMIIILMALFFVAIIVFVIAKKLPFMIAEKAATAAST